MRLQPDDDRPGENKWVASVVTDYNKETGRHILVYGILEGATMGGKQEDWEEVNLR